MGGGGVPMGTQGALWPPRGTRRSPSLAPSVRPADLPGPEHGADGRRRAVGQRRRMRPRLPSGRASIVRRIRADWRRWPPMGEGAGRPGRAAAWPRRRPRAPAGERGVGPAVVRSARPGRRHQGRRRPAHGPRRGRPAGRLRLRRHRPGAARHRRLRQRGQGGRRARRWRAATLDAARRLSTSSGPASTSSSRRWPARMKLVVPVTLLIVIVLLFLQFRNFVEVLIILLSIPFALIGSVWLLWLLDYRLSTAVLGRHHRARRPGRADRHRHDRLHRPRLPAPEGGGAHQRPRRHHRRAHGRHRPARAPQADDGVDDADRPGPAAVGARARAPT